MPTFSKSSLEKLLGCHADLQRLFLSVIEETDCQVLCGHRNEREQTMAFNAGTSKLRWPISRHNSLPAMAADVVPYPIDWHDHERFREFAKVVKRHAEKLGIKVDHGGDWKMRDFPHWQLKG